MGRKKAQAGLPKAVREYVRRVFADANRIVTRKLSEIPSAHEPQLDMSLIESLSREPSPPKSLTAGWHVYIETHFLGGRAMFMNWEVADIGLLVQVRQRGKLVQAKTGLLQSKRLYPEEIRRLPDLRRRYEEGFFSLMLTDEEHALRMGGRQFQFKKESVYLAYDVRGEQEQRIAEYQKQRNIPIYYLFYNPRELPWSATVPFVKRAPNTRPPVGCRVVPARTLADTLSSKADGAHPSYADLLGLPEPFRVKSRWGGWRLETFMTEELVDGSEGHITTKDDTDSLYGLFFNRSGPISSAISITIEAPPNAALVLPEPK